MNHEKIEQFLTTLAGDDVVIEEELNDGEGWALNYEYPETYLSASGWGDHHSEVEMPSRERDTLVGITPLSLMALMLSLCNNPDGISGTYGIGLDVDTARSLEYYADKAAGQGYEWVWVKEVTQNDAGDYVLHCQNTIRPRITVPFIKTSPLSTVEVPTELKGAMFLTYGSSGQVEDCVTIHNKNAL